MFAAFGRANYQSSVTFVSKAAAASGVLDSLQLQKRMVPVSNTRTIKKKDMIHNAYQPNIEVDAQTYQVRADGELLVCEPATELPLAQRYFLF
jgi:urease subunit alpha